MAVGSRAMDRMNRVRPPTCPYGPWTVARWTGTPSSGPVHGPGVVRVAVPAWAFAWTTYLVGPPNGPWSVRVVRDAGPHMGFRVGRMIGPACGPLVHSHDVVRKRAGHADGPHASTWPIRPPGPWSRTPAMAHTAWSMPPSVSDRPVRPIVKGAGPSSDSVPFIVCDYARSFFILLAAFLWTVLSSRTETRLSNVMFPAIRPAPIGSKK